MAFGKLKKKLRKLKKVTKNYAKCKSKLNGYKKRRDSYKSQRDNYKIQRDGYKDERDGYKDERDGYKDERDGYKDERDGYKDERDTLSGEKAGLVTKLNNVEEDCFNSTEELRSSLNNCLNPSPHIDTVITAAGDKDTGCLTYRGCFDYTKIFLNKRDQWSKRIWAYDHLYYKKKMVHIALCNNATHIGIINYSNNTKKYFKYVYGVFSETEFNDTTMVCNSKCNIPDGSIMNLFRPASYNSSITIYRINPSHCNTGGPANIQEFCKKNRYYLYRGSKYNDIPNENTIPRNKGAPSLDSIECFSNPNDIINKYYAQAPSVCMPPTCKPNASTDATIRINSFGINETNNNKCTTNSPHACLDNLYTTNSLGLPTTANSTNSLNNLYTQTYKKKTDKIFVNCPSNYNAKPGTLKCTSTTTTTTEEGTTEEEGTNVDEEVKISECRPNKQQVQHSDYIFGVDTSTNDNACRSGCCKYYEDDETEQIWLTKNIPKYNQFNSEKLCKKWCENNEDCGGVQSFYKYKFAGDSETHPADDGYTYCNYYNKNINLDKDSSYITGSGYNTWVKQKQPYTITPDTQLPTDCEDTDIGFGCCPDRITHKTDINGNNCSLSNSLYHTNKGVNPNLDKNHNELLGGTSQREIDLYEVFSSHCNKTNYIILFTIIFIILLFYNYI
jgi:hypothetical protein